MRGFVKKVIPAAILSLYSLLGGAMFMWLSWGGRTREGLECDMSYWEGLYFASSIYTTTGNAAVNICSLPGQFATIVYALVGIPLALAALDGLGELMVAAANAGWAPIAPFLPPLSPKALLQHCRKTEKKELPVEEVTADSDEDRTMPIGVALLLILWCCSHFLWQIN